MNSPIFHNPTPAPPEFTSTTPEVNAGASLEEQLLTLRGLNAALASENQRLKQENGHLHQDREDLLGEVLRLGPIEDAHEDAHTGRLIAEAENKMNADQVQRLRIDNKTGLLTSLAWEEETRSQMQLRRRGTDTAPCYVVLADLDRFKSVNDTYGHMYGDVVLRETGKAARETLDLEPGQVDRRRHSKPLAGRFGGEELVFWLPDMTSQDAVLFAKRFQAAVNEISYADRPDAHDTPIDTIHGRDTQGISIGIAEVHIDPRDLEKSLHEALGDADKILYEIKESGRNGIGVFLPPAAAAEV